ncbi:MAG: GAF domain-containing sensor histidine kinase, partial [Candidatus Omnitrophica bacterium]|nr:GAF domain-containing sensor histidine kinase [Candidatus Omnitrophota bacterium]
GLDKSLHGMTLSMNNTLTTFLDRTRAYLSIKDQGKDSPFPQQLVENMNKLRLVLAVPLTIYDDMIGILTLGKKKSDMDYTPEDVDIIITLARTLAIAISNARTLDELGKTQAEAAQREKMAVIGTLSAGINHEICNPLGIARGQCEAFLLNMRDGLYKNKTDKELVEKSVVIMQKVIHETDRATAITKRLSSFAKPSKGLYNEDINLRDSINDVMALISYEMKLDKIEIENNVAEDLPHIVGDKKQIEEVFFNLIRNAAQAIPDRGKIMVSGRKEGKSIHVNVEDTGQGIPADKLDQIFNPFYTTKEPGKGTGLGLFIVRQVVEKNEGRISVRSQVGVGTTFTLQFPLGVSEAVRT